MSIQRLLQQAAAGAGDTGDDEFANVVLLLDGDGTSGDANNTFTDSSTNAFTVTESGSVVQGSFSPYGDNWSNYFGSGNKLKTAGSSDFAFGTGDFSIDFWMNCESFSSIVGVINTQTSDSAAGAGMWYIRIDNSTTLRFGRHGSPQYVEGATSFSVNTWHHIHVSRVSSTVRLFVDGVSLSLTNTGGGLDTYDFNSNGTNLTVGFTAANNPMPGYMSNVRIIKGTSSENKTANFTPPTEPLTAVTNTVLLTCQSNRFVDNSSSSHTFSVDGTPKVTPFSPFKNDDARDITTDGGSAYFNYGPYLTLPQDTEFNFGTGDFTVEFWANVDTYRTSGSYYDAFVTFGFYTSSPYFRIHHDGRLAFGLVSAEYYSTSTIDTGEWNHYAISRSGTTVRLFVNGTLETTATNSATLGNSAAVTIGTSSWLAANEEMKGYLSDVRIVKGSAVYTSSFTPPTAPLTAVTNTSALLSFQDSGIYDRAGINNLDTVGDAQIDTAVKKYGTGSLEFDGTGDYIQPVVTASELALGTGDFTIEFWMYPTSVSSTPVAVLSNRYDGSSDNVFQIGFDDGSSRGIHLHTQVTAGINTGVSATANTWQHIAFVRSNGTLSCYKDGTSIGTPTTFTKDLSYTVPPLIGKDGERSPSGTSANFAGYLDDLRITKGVARYTSNFTAPTAALLKF